LLGEGETGSPRSRLRARDTAVGGACNVADGDGDGGGEGEASRMRGTGLDLEGVANGFGNVFLIGEDTCFCFPLFFSGENGLKVDKGAVASTGRGRGREGWDFLGVDGAGGGLDAFL